MLDCPRSFWNIYLYPDPPTTTAPDRERRKEVQDIPDLIEALRRSPKILSQFVPDCRRLAWVWSVGIRRRDAAGNGNRNPQKVSTALPSKKLSVARLA